jgi:hypothetical protein
VTVLGKNPLRVFHGKDENRPDLRVFHGTVLAIGKKRQKARK